jgi:serine/threonine protein kinase
MAPLPTCPDEPELLRIAMGEPVDDALLDHVADCSNCRARVEQLRAEVASLVGSFQDGQTSLPTQADPDEGDHEETPSGGTTLDWPSADPAGTPPTEPIGAEAVAAARERAEARPDLPGAIGRYLVVDRLDEGGQGQVYRVIHPKLGKNLVLKLGHRPVDHDERSSLVAEGRLLHDLDHINLVKIYDLDFHNDRPFLVMEYVHGRNLEQYAEEEPVTPRRAAAIVAKLAGALAAAHRRGIIHRDIKPRNVVVDEAGQPRLIDFGLARLRHAWSDSPDPTWGGTLAYMAPEQAWLEHDRTGPRSDIFGLGAVLYFLLTGQAPFVGETVEEVWDRARRCEFEAGGLRLVRAPRRLERICLKAMAADPAQRYATADDMRRALEWFVSRPRRIGAGAAILLAAAILSALYLRPQASQRSLSDQGTNTAFLPPGPTPTPIPSPTRPAPLHGGITLRVEKRKPGDAHESGLRLHEPGAVPVKAGDGIRVEAWVDRPAYLYVFWIGADGQVAPIYPWKDQDWTTRPEHEEKVKTLDLPAEDVRDTWPLPPSPPGLETLVLLAREDSPLSRDADATLGRDLAGPRTTRIPAEMTRAVWLDNGREFGLDDQGRDRAAPSSKPRRSDDPVLQIRELLQKRVQPLGAYHRAVIVPNQGGH